jgi:cytochrome c oxidase assembly factor CtaG
MSDTLLDYASWSFQLIMVLAIVYLVAGLIKPAWVKATNRSTIVVASVVVMLLASTAFYFAVRPLPGALESPAALNASPP